MCSTRSSTVSTWPYIIVAVVDMPSRWAWRITPIHSLLFVFFGAMMSRTRSTSTSPPPPGSRVQPRVPEARQRLRDVELRAARDVLDLGRRERVQVDPVALLDRAEQILVVLDPEIGVVAALHQHAGAAERERLLDLLEDHRLRQQVALGAVARAAVEGAEVAVGDADVRVVEVPVDDERDAPGIGLAARAARWRRGRRRAGRASEAASTRLAVVDPLAARAPSRGSRAPTPSARRSRTFGHQTVAAAVTKRSSGTSSSSPTSRASSRKV